MVVWLTIAAAVAVVFLAWNLYGRFGSDHIQALTEQRRSTSRMVGRGEFVDANRHHPVALAVTQSTFFYESRELQASVDLQWIDEIEYDNELATGNAIAGGTVLRLRTHSRTFEFVIPSDMVSRWHTALPARRSTPSTAPPAIAPAPVVAV